MIAAEVESKCTHLGRAPLTAAVYGAQAHYNNDLAVYAPATLLGLIQLILDFIEIVSPILQLLLILVIFALVSALGLYTLKRLLMLLSKKVKAAFDSVSNLLMRKMLNWFKRDLAPLRATVQQLLNGQPDALKITDIPPSIVGENNLYVKNRPPFAKSRPSASFEADPPKPRRKLKRPWLPQPHAEVTPNIDTPRGSTATNSVSEPVDERHLSGSAAVAITSADQDYGTLEPVSTRKTKIFQWKFDEYTEILTELMSLPVDVNKPPKGFVSAVSYVRSNKKNVEKLAGGLKFVKFATKLIKRSIKELSKIAKRPVSKELLKIKRSLDKAEAKFAKACDLKLIVKNIKLIEAGHADESFKKHMAPKTYGGLVFGTQRQIIQLFQTKQAIVEEYLNECGCLCDTFNAERERILTSARDLY